jgi:hypothetical protein
MSLRFKNVLFLCGLLGGVELYSGEQVWAVYKGYTGERDISVLVQPGQLVPCVRGNDEEAGLHPLLFFVTTQGEFNLKKTCSSKAHVVFLNPGDYGFDKYVSAPQGLGAFGAIGE